MADADFSKLGLIAGDGDLPERLAKHATDIGRGVFVVGVKGFVQQSLLDAYDSCQHSIGEIGKQLSALKAAGVREVCFAGIVKRPNFNDLKLDAKGMMLLPRVVKAATRGDDELLRVLVSVVEADGFKVVGADDVLGGLLAPEGAIGDISPSEQDLKDVLKAARIAGEIGAMDIGQGAVVCRGLVLAVEAQEGTDLMLQRCASLPAEIRGDESNRAGALVKRPKPMQERRIDLPTIGIKTVEGAARAGLSGVGVAAGAALIIDREAVVERANALGMWIYGIPNSDLN